MITPSDNALVTLDLLQNYLDDTADKDAELLQLLINDVSSEFEDYCERTFRYQKDLVEIHDGVGNNNVYLNQWPINMTSQSDVKVYLSLSANGLDFPESSLVANTNYFVYPDIGMIAIPLYLTKWWRAIKVVYSPGYKTLPGDLQWQCLVTCAVRWKKKISGTEGVNSVSIGANQSISLSTDTAFPASTQQVLDQYINPHRFR